MIVQIYEVTTPAEARALGAMGVDHIGVLVGDGSFPREQTIEKAREIFAAIPSRYPASRGGATAPLASTVADPESRVSASLSDAEHSGR